MKVAKVLVALVGIYAMAVLVVAGVIGYVQPEGDLVLTTTDAEGNAVDRSLAAVRVDGRLYVSANQWPRRWYYRALENPRVEVTVNGVRGAYYAVPVEGAELERIEEKYELELVWRVLAGFAPRRFLRLDPR